MIIGENGVPDDVSCGVENRSPFTLPVPPPEGVWQRALGGLDPLRNHIHIADSGPLMGRVSAA